MKSVLVVAVVAATAALAIPANDKSGVPSDTITRLAKEACNNVAIDGTCYADVEQKLKEKHLNGAKVDQRAATEAVLPLVEGQAGQTAVAEAKSQAEAKCGGGGGEAKCLEPAYWISLHAHVLCNDTQINPSMEAKQCQDAAVARQTDWYRDTNYLSWYKISREGFAGSIKSYGEAMQYAAKACADDDKCREAKTTLFAEAASTCRMLQFPGDKQCQDVAVDVAEKKSKASQEISWSAVRRETAKQVYNTTPERLVEHRSEFRVVTCTKAEDGSKLNCGVMTTFRPKSTNDSESIVSVCASHGGCPRCDASGMATGLHVKMLGRRFFKRMEHRVDFTCELTGKTQG